MTWLPGKLPYSRFLEKNNKEFETGNNELLTTRINKNRKGQIISVLLMLPNWELQVQQDGVVKLQERDGPGAAHLSAPALLGDVWQITKIATGHEFVYGLGESTSTLALNGSQHEFWNTSPSGSYGKGEKHLYMKIPVLISSGQHGSHLVFFENSHKGSATISQSGTTTVKFAAGALRIFCFTGPPDSLIKSYTKLTGRPSLPPAWSLGFHQCRWGYQSADDLINILEGFEENALPLQALHQDIDYMIGYRVFTLDHSRFADINTLNEVMAIRNIKFVPILDPGVMVDSNYSIYKSRLKKDLFVKNRDGSLVRAPVWPGWCVFPDFTSKKARAWWGQHYQELLDFGAAGISHDMNEPETFAAWGSSTLPEDCLHDLDGAEGNHLEAHNLYGHLMNKSGYEALRNLRPDRRPWLLSRSGWAGSQRFAWNWTADIESSWDALKVSISMLINLGLSGIPFSGTDIGGFSGNPDAELFLRWFQLAAFHPFFRNHAAKGTQSREPWVYGEPYTSIIRKTMQARMALLPYLYTLAEEASRTGAPLTLPLFWLAPKQQFLHDINDAFLLGNDLLIAPVTEPGMTSRPVALPPGDWYDFKTGELYSGGGNINIATPLESIPVFARGGSIIPLEKEKELVLNIYPDKNGIAHGNIFYDAGDGYGETGSAEFKCVREGAALRLSVTKKGAYRFPWKQIRPEIIGENASKAIEVSC